MTDFNANPSALPKVISVFCAATAVEICTVELLFKVLDFSTPSSEATLTEAIKSTVELSSIGLVDKLPRPDIVSVLSDPDSDRLLDVISAISPLVVEPDPVLTINV